MLGLHNYYNYAISVAKRWLDSPLPSKLQFVDLGASTTKICCKNVSLPALELWSRIHNVVLTRRSVVVATNLVSKGQRSTQHSHSSFRGHRSRPKNLLPYPLQQRRRWIIALRSSSSVLAALVRTTVPTDSLNVSPERTQHARYVVAEPRHRVHDACSCVQ